MRLRELTELTEEDYRGEHQAPGPEDGAPMWNVSANGIYPEDFYSHLGFRYYGAEDQDYPVISLVQRYRWKPNGFITVYRSIPKASPRGTKINPGDWVALAQRYAREHGRSNLNNQFRIVKLTVRPRDIFTDGNSIQEWGYVPQPPVMQDGRPVHSHYNPMRRPGTEPPSDTLIGTDQTTPTR